MKIYLTILLMAIVTYIPRFLPMSFIDIERVPPKLKKFLYFIPYAALGALIFPGGLNAIPGNTSLSIMAILITIIISAFFENIVLVVFSSILVAYFLLRL